jgi:hypothetical protein
MIPRLTNGRAGASNAGVSLMTKGVVGRVGFLSIVFRSAKSFVKSFLNRSFTEDRPQPR